MSTPNRANLIDHFNLYQKSHPNLVHCWTTYLALKKKHDEDISAAPNDDVIANECKIILNYLESGELDYTNEDIMRVLLFKASLLDDSLFDMIRI